MWLRSVLAGLSAVILAALVPAPATANTVQITPVYFAVPVSTSVPVNKVVANWNLNNKGITLIRVTSCIDYDPCVTINVSYVNINKGGGVFWYDGTHHIELFYWSNITYDERRMILCHELGHYLSVGHSNHGCMRSYIRTSSGDIDPKPYAGDYNRQRIMAPV